MSSISNWDDIIDSRDVNERIDELEAIAESGDSQLDQDERVELLALVHLRAEAENYSEDWTYGVTLIRYSYFQNYAEQLAEDLGYITGDVTWPFTCIDWEQAAHELRQDYTSVDFDGVTYWVR